MKSSNYDKFPVIKAQLNECITGWDTIAQEILAAASTVQGKPVIAIECYPGVNTSEIRNGLLDTIKQAHIIDTATAFKSEEEINKMVYPYVTDDPVFGYITPLALKDFFDAEKVARLISAIESSPNNLVLVIGAGASLIAEQPALLIYADMPRWEIQLRFRKQAVPNLGVSNNSASFSYLYKRAFFVDWRVCDRQKKALKNKIDFWLDTTKADEPKLATAAAINQALASAVQQPFRVVPFFDPGPWGGQWLKEEFDLDRSEKNFAWGFDCVPEENSLLIQFKNDVFELPSINLVFDHPQELLGEKVYRAFGDEFPIRFDFLDTMQGGNLSLQVHPLMEYIREKFGMGYTQDESYYFLEAADDAFVYLGLKENIVPEKMIAGLESAQAGNGPFEAEQYVEKWPIKKHDHILIPAGTVHCSGANSVVLEISATPYIFTFKLWDWGRMGLDGKPRPISIAHGKNVIQWQRTTEWTKENLVNKFEPITEGDGWREERTGLSTTSFIETRRHWFTKTVQHNTHGVVNVLNLIEGREAIVESPLNAFEPFIIHYAETFIVPAAVGAYTITPHGESSGKQCATIKASVRTNNLKNYRIN
ncbi:class I mannose-6-phosphate isomerase [Mucilaginibacter rigui]|uniref:class I mannose-6-phosphate isomerase n=1 Tax=Mucilaginibacter rigui TaxID=534635 RepID=UPI001CD06FD0|nr:class I mannose-6-phosphate isomerase [Mucilaginibacter rigui]